MGCPRLEHRLEVNGCAECGQHYYAASLERPKAVLPPSSFARSMMTSTRLRCRGMAFLSTSGSSLTVSLAHGGFASVEENGMSPKFTVNRDAPVYGFNLARVIAARRLPYSLGGMSIQFLGLAEAGFFAVLLVVTMLLRWFEAILFVIAKRWTYDDEPRQRRTLIWALPVVLTLHSGPWAAAVFAFLSWYLVSGVGEPSGFGWGLGAGALLMASLICSALIRARRHRRVA